MTAQLQRNVGLSNKEVINAVATGVAVVDLVEAAKSDPSAALNLLEFAVQHVAKFVPLNTSTDWFDDLGACFEDLAMAVLVEGADPRNRRPRVH